MKFIYFIIYFITLSLSNYFKISMITIIIVYYCLFVYWFDFLTSRVKPRTSKTAHRVRLALHYERRDYFGII